jgi:putative membrane protein
MTQPVKLCVLLAIVVGLGLTNAVGAEQAVSDQEFVTKAATGNLMEVHMGKLGVERATNANVKQFAQRMVDDHTKANKELLSIADLKKENLPKDLAKDKEHEAAMKKFAELKGAEFDRAYMKQMVADHQKTISLFEAQAKNGKDAKLKAFAEKTLPTLREHLKQAQEIESKL